MDDEKATSASSLSLGRESSGDDIEVIPEMRHPTQSPLFRAEHMLQYQRQTLIQAYQTRFSCRLIAMKDTIFADSITFLEELIYDADPREDLHLLLASPGGDGEVAVRLVRSAQARCNELTVIVPDQAKSAATLLAMGAHHILMGPTSDLGPVDPQFYVGEPKPDLVAAKDVIAAVSAAEVAIAENPDVHPLHTTLLSDVSAVLVQQARSAIGRTGELVEEALRSHPERGEEEVQRLKAALSRPLIDAPRDHAAVFGASDALRAGLPVVVADPASDQWKLAWQLWAHYFQLQGGVYEGANSSRVVKGGHHDAVDSDREGGPESLIDDTD